MRHVDKDNHSTNSQADHGSGRHTSRQFDAQGGGVGGGGGYGQAALPLICRQQVKLRRGSVIGCLPSEVCIAVGWQGLSCDGSVGTTGNAILHPEQYNRIIVCSLDSVNVPLVGIVWYYVHLVYCYLLV